MWPNPVDLVTFTDEILNGKFHFLCSVNLCENCLKLLELILTISYPAMTSTSNSWTRLVMHPRSFLSFFILLLGEFLYHLKKNRTIEIRWMVALVSPFLFSLFSRWFRMVVQLDVVPSVGMKRGNKIVYLSTFHPTPSIMLDSMLDEMLDSFSRDFTNGWTALHEFHLI